MSTNKQLDKLFQDAFLEVFVNKVVIHTEREINKLVESLSKSIEELDKKLKEYALDRLVKDDIELLNYKLNQESSAAKARIYEELNKEILQQREFAQVVDFLAGMISSALESYSREIPKVRVAQTELPQQMQNIAAPGVSHPTAGQPQIDASQTVMQQVTRQLEEINKENKELKAKNISLMKHLKEVEKDKQITEERLKELQQEIKERDNKIKQVITKLIEYRNKLEELKKGMGAAKVPEEKTSQLEQEINSLKAEHVIVKDKNVKLTKHLEELNQKIRRYEEENGELKAKVAQQNVQNEQIAAELEKVKNVLVRLQEEKSNLEKQIAQNISKATRFDKLIMQISILDEFMKNNPQYAALRILSDKISEGKFEVMAEELGYRKEAGVSLAAWLTNMFGHLKDMELVDFKIETSEGYPKGYIVVTDKGKRAFIDLRNKLFSSSS